MPGFNVNGKTDVRSSIGGFLSLLVGLILLVYALSKSTHLASVTGATISTYEQAADYTKENPINLNQRNAKVAFAFVGAVDQQPRHDPAFVKIIPRLRGKENGKLHEKILPYHVCTEDDFADFYPVTLEF